MAPRATSRSLRTAGEEARMSPAPIDLGWLAGLIGFKLRVAHEASARVFSHSVSSNAPHYAILSLIKFNPGLTQIALSRAVSRDSSSMTALLDDLCDRGLIVRERSPDDRRSYALSITKAGLKTLDDLKRKVDVHERDLNALFSREEKARLIEMLDRIATGLAR
ncbi:MAG: MarR family transcriptional regulator [Rhodopseudomonas sp.]|nr:MarR family transcriptional regulator [Rhodopseudomonas sp.]